MQILEIDRNFLQKWGDFIRMHALYFDLPPTEMESLEDILASQKQVENSHFSFKNKT